MKYQHKGGFPLLNNMAEPVVAVLVAASFLVGWLGKTRYDKYLWEKDEKKVLEEKES